MFWQFGEAVVFNCCFLWNFNFTFYTNVFFLNTNEERMTIVNNIVNFQFNCLQEIN